MRRLYSFKSKTNILVAAAFLTVATVGLGGDGWAKTNQVGKWGRGELQNACEVAGGTYYDHAAAYGCVGTWPRIDCVKGYTNCWSTTRTVVLGGKGRLGGITAGTPVRRSAGAWPPNVCDLCFTSCPRWSYFCRLHCETRGGCPRPTGGLSIR
jgi:hypothetical protein